MSTKTSLAIDQIPAAVESAVQRQPVTDMHTHVFAPAFGCSPDPQGLMLWGIDELVTYHYLIAEAYRVVGPDILPYDKFWSLPRAEQADHIWKCLFVDRTPISEACRGVITTLTALGLDPNEKSLEPYRRWFAQQDPDAYVDRVMELANVDRITMTNEVFADHERSLWLRDPEAMRRDGRFRPVLRIDTLLLDWPRACRVLSQLGYEVGGELNRATIDQARQFLRDWIARMRPDYVAVSLPPDFHYPSDGPASAAIPTPDAILDQVVLPDLAEANLPLALMIGCRRAINPALRDAGDGVGRMDVQAVCNLCVRNPGQRFLITMLSRENQHELCVAARKFANLMVFGCWWFLNNPSLIEEITRMRLEMLGTSFVPQHSDARILDQLIYKWQHSRAIIARVLADRYQDLARAGFAVTPAQIQRDVALLLRDNYRALLN